MFTTSDFTTATMATDYQQLMNYFGVLSDRGAKFTGQVWNHLQDVLGCKMYHSLPYHPQGNSITKQSHRIISNMLWSSLLKDPHLNWEEVLPVVQLTLNTIEHSSHMVKPSQVLLGASAHHPMDCHLPSALPPPVLPHDESQPPTNT